MADQKLTKVRELRLAKPFRPYALTLKDGRRIFISERMGLGVTHECTRATTTDELGKLVFIGPGDIEKIEVYNPQELN